MVTVGIDEVGRGCWAGPLVVGAVILNEPIAGLRDSKKLTKGRREKLATEIEARAAAIGLGWSQPNEIDELGLTAAITLATKRALERIAMEYDRIIIDGNLNYLQGNPKARAVIKADDSVPAVSAASIIAKVARDKYMSEIAGSYPDYGFTRHVGYGTALHLERLKLHGASDLHRRSFKPVAALLQ
jgi:ribonuclease HII